MQSVAFSTGKSHTALVCHLERSPNDRRERGRSRKIPTLYYPPCSVREFFLFRENTSMLRLVTSILGMTGSLGCTRDFGWRLKRRQDTSTSTTRSHALALRSGWQT